MADESKQPNILFLIADQHRPDFLGLNPDLAVRTPNLDQMAVRGVAFSNALCPSPLCAPSRASLAAGRRYPHCGVINNQEDYPLTQPTFYGMLRDSGYHVAGVGKFDLQKARAQHSLDGKAFIREWGFSDGIDSRGKWDAVNSWDGEPHDAYMAYLHRRGLAEIHLQDMARRRSKAYAETSPTPLPEAAYADNWVADQGLMLLETFPDDRSWFLQVNFSGPHDPVDVTERMWERWQDVDFAPAHANDQFDAETHERIRRNYAAMVENIDRHLGRYLDAIRARGEIANTLIVYTSDHGEMLGDHNLWAKSTYYQPAVGIPLIIAGHNVAPHRRFDGVVSLHDLAATFLDYAHLTPPDFLDSRSLRPVLTGTTLSHRPYVTSGLIRRGESWHLIYDGRHKLVSIKGQAPILFDLEADPWEDVNAAAEKPDLVAQLQTWLDTALQTPEA